MRRIALPALSLFALGAISHLGCGQPSNLFGAGGTSSSSSSSSLSSSQTTAATTTSTSSSSSTGTTTSTSTVTSTGSSGPTCMDPETDCPTTGTKCATATCSATHTCTSVNAAAGTACTDNGGVVCDGNGTCVACVTPSDCGAEPTLCVTNTCAGNVCGMANAPLGAVCNDGGGKVCNGHGQCLQCNGTGDCTAPDVCLSSKCVPPSCADGIKDGNETSVDCGGGTCPPCANTKTCLVRTDCKSGFCDSGTCEPCSQDVSCASGDYCNGGVCAAQEPAGATCAAGDQCQSGFCADDVCCASVCDGTCDVCDLPGMAGTCNVEPADSNNANHPCPGGVCTGPAGSPANSCVPCLENGDCNGATGRPVCDTMADAEANTCVACNANGDCAGGACDAHACDKGNWLSPNDAGPLVTAPSCAGNLVSVANAACAAAYAGSHWCTANDANGTGTYHPAACMALDFQFNGGVTCAANGWSTDIGSSCVAGIITPAVQPYVAVGAQHEVDCCD